MTLRKRTTIDENANEHHVFDFEADEDESTPSYSDDEIDSIEIRHDPDNPDVLYVYGYNGDEQVYQHAFKTRDLSFDPVSALGRGESERLMGASSNDGDDSEQIPSSVATALNAIGLAVVPEGEWWLDE